jgi:hypothetical protein
MTHETDEAKITPTGRRFQTVVGAIWVLMLSIVIVASFFPELGRKRQIQLGEEANRNLEALFRAKEDYARELRIDLLKPLPDDLVNLSNEALAPYLPAAARGLDWSPRGSYSLGPLVDEFGEIVTPIHHSESHDPDGNGATNAQEGLYIHRRSHLQDPETGIWLRDPAFVFPQ